jgi:hypothetical protein
MPPAARFHYLTNTWVVVAIADIELEVGGIRFGLHVIVLCVYDFVKAFHKLNIYVVHEIGLFYFSQVEGCSINLWNSNFEESEKVGKIVFIYPDLLLEKNVDKLVNFQNRFIYQRLAMMSKRSKTWWLECGRWIVLFNRRTVANEMSWNHNFVGLLTPSLFQVSSSWCLDLTLSYGVARQSLERFLYEADRAA